MKTTKLLEENRRRDMCGIESGDEFLDTPPKTSIKNFVKWP